MDYNEEMMHYQNWYNSPTEQMKRYSAAGLNPNLIYGNGSSSAGNMSNAPTAPRSKDYIADPSIITDAIGAYVSMEGLKNTQRATDSSIALNEVQQGLVKANTQKSIEESLTETAKRLMYGANAAKTDWERDRSQQLFQTQYEAERLNLKKIKQDISRSIAETKRVNLERAYYPSFIQAQIAKDRWDTHLKQTINRNSQTQGRILDKDLKYYTVNQIIGGASKLAPYLLLFK